MIATEIEIFRRKIRKKLDSSRTRTHDVTIVRRALCPLSHRVGRYLSPMEVEQTASPKTQEGNTTARKRARVTTDEHSSAVEVVGVGSSAQDKSHDPTQVI